MIANLDQAGTAGRALAAQALQEVPVDKVRPHKAAIATALEKEKDTGIKDVLRKVLDRLGSP